MNKLNFSWLIDNEVAGHAEPLGHDDLEWLFQNGIRALVRMSEKPKVVSDEIERAGMNDMHEPVPDFTAPSQTQLDRIVDFMLESVGNGKPVGVSCGAGLGRTGTVLACYLAKRRFSAKGLVLEVRKTRPGAVETEEQLKAIEQYVRRVCNVAQKVVDCQPVLRQLMNMGAERNYGRGFEHADIVTKLSQDLYEAMLNLQFFPKTASDLLLLKASGYLHDVGYPPDSDHNISGFAWLKERLNRPDVQDVLPNSERSIVLYCVLWHRGNDFSTVEEVTLQPKDLKRARHLASLLRIADGLCYPSGRPTQKVSIKKEKSILVIEACPSKPGEGLSVQTKKAFEKRNLLEEVLKETPAFGVTEVQVRKCSNPDC